MNEHPEPTPTPIRPLFFGLGLALTVFIADQISKWVIVNWVMNPPHVIEVTPFFNLVLAWNRGVSFSMFADSGHMMPWILTAIAVIITGSLTYWLSGEKDRPTQIALGMIIGGAIGNVIDRILFGAVIDFLYFHYGDWYFPAFNLADSGISVGATLIVLRNLFPTRKVG